MVGAARASEARRRGAGPLQRDVVSGPVLPQVVQRIRSVEDKDGEQQHGGLCFVLLCWRLIQIMGVRDI